MSIKISELPQATSVSSNDIVPIVQNGTTKKATKGMIAPAIATSITSSSTNDEVAGAKAVYDLNENSKISAISGHNTSVWTNTTANQYNTISLSQFENIGNVFEISNDRIVCLKDVTGLISVNCTVEAKSVNTNKYLQIFKNGTPYFGVLKRPAITGVILFNIAGLLISAKQGDYFDVRYYGIQNEYVDTNRLYVSMVALNILETTTTNSLNTASLMNTGLLVGMGDRAELTSLATDNEELEKVEEVTPTEELSVVKDKTEGSGDTI